MPIRWRLAGGSAALTFVILAGFAAIVNALTDRQVLGQLDNQVSAQGAQLQQQLGRLHFNRKGAIDCFANVPLSYYAAAQQAQIRILDPYGEARCTQNEVFARGQKLPRGTTYFMPRAHTGTFNELGYRVNQLNLRVAGSPNYTLLYALPLSDTDHTISKVRVFLILGVLGGTLLALLAGLANAQRAMRPIRQLTAAAREIERTRDPSRRIPHPEAEDEIAELARTLEGMLAALDEARSANEAALARQREFVADASHELRTPLTSVLANLELLSEELSGEQAESAQSALRSTQRMRRLVGDLLLLARADARRSQPDRPTDLAEVLIEAAAEIEPIAEDHELVLDPGSAVVPGRRDDLHRMVLNLLENAIRHTPAGTHIWARTGEQGGVPVLIVQDDGPGIPPLLRRRVFERFVRGGGDAGSSSGSGLGLSIVRAVADSHGASVTLGPGSADGYGTRFEIRFSTPAAAGSEPVEPLPRRRTRGRYTSTTTGRTIGRRRSRS